MTNQKKKAFTLAEVLITLGIIGVVAAIVMPAIKTKLFEQEIVAKFKQTYSILDNAVRMMQAEEGCTGSSCFKDVQKPDIETIASNIDKHFRYTRKICYASSWSTPEVNKAKWLPDNAYSLSGSAVRASYVVYKRTESDSSRVCLYQLLNGANVAFTRMNAFDKPGSGVLHIAIDVNGVKGPNRVGKDNFPVVAGRTANGLSPYWYVHPWASSTFWGGICTQYTKPEPCQPSAYVLHHGKLPDLEAAGFPAKP